MVYGNSHGLGFLVFELLNVRSLETQDFSVVESENNSSGRSLRPHLRHVFQVQICKVGSKAVDDCKAGDAETRSADS